MILIECPRFDSATAVISDEGFALSDCKFNLLDTQMILIECPRFDSATAVISDEGFALSDCKFNLLDTQMSKCLEKVNKYCCCYCHTMI